jgi:hypothetical protein
MAGTVDDAIKLARGGISEEVILAWAENQGPAKLSRADIFRMHDSNVSDKVIVALLKKSLEEKKAEKPVEKPAPKVVEQPAEPVEEVVATPKVVYTYSTPVYSYPYPYYTYPYYGMYLVGSPYYYPRSCPRFSFGAGFYSHGFHR